MKVFHEELDKFMTEKQMSNTELAKLIHKSVSSVRKYRSGVQTPDRISLSIMGEALAGDETYFLSEEFQYFSGRSRI